MKELAYLNKYFVKYKWHLLLGIIFIICTNYFKVQMPQIFDNVSDLIEKELDLRKDGEGNPDVFTQGMILFGWFLAFALIQTFFLFLTRQTIIVMSRLIEFDLKNEVYNKYQALSYSFFKVNSTGDIMNRISEDVSKVRMYLGPAIMYSINVCFLFVMIIYQMFSANVELSIYVLLPLPIMSYIIFKVSNLINIKSEITQKQQSKLSTFAQEAFSGIRVLKAFGREEYFTNRFDEESEHYKRASLSLAWTNSLFVPVIITLIGVSTIVTIYVGGLKVIAGDMDFGDISKFIIYVNMLTWPFASIGWVSSLIQRAAASQKRLNEFLKEEIEIKESENPLKEEIGSVRFDDVSFTYPNTGVEALKNVSFEIAKGQTLSITGKTGSGKSTIAALIERLYDSSNGNVVFNEENLKNYDISNFRGQIGYVPQEVFLFSDTINNNIAFGVKDGEVTTDRIKEVAKDAHIHHNIMQFEEDYQTKIGERGVTLSGGQKQRISIARAIIRNPNVLIFDDCLSAVDTETEEIILNNLKRIMNNKINIIIGHRISSLKHADQILVMDDGRVIERGSHLELLDLGGWYANTYEKQLLKED